MPRPQDVNGGDSTRGARPVLVDPAFASPERCHKLIQAFQRVVDGPVPMWRRSPVRTTTHRREVDGRYLAVVSPRTRAVLSDLREHAVRAVRQHYGVRGPLAIEFTLLTQMGPGDFHPRHADNERQASDGTWVPNHTPMRDYVAMLYLNASGVNYSGGILRFPQLRLEIAPATGALVAFTCGHEHEHEVTPVDGGARFSISMWMTCDRFCFEPWDVDPESNGAATD